MTIDQFSAEFLAKKFFPHLTLQYAVLSVLAVMEAHYGCKVEVMPF